MPDKEHLALLEKAVAFICTRLPTVQGIYLFGTFASEYERPDSDIDLALLGEKVPATVELWNLAQELARELHRDVDLIDLQAANTIFRYQVIAEGRRIYTSDGLYCDRFELQALSSYYRFAESRKDLLSDYLENQEP